MKGKNLLKRYIGLLMLCSLAFAPHRVAATPESSASHDAPKQSSQDCILVISSYNPEASRMASFVSEFERLIIAEDIPCDIYVETLQCKNIGDAPQWIAQINNLIDRYESRRLRTIVLLGQEAWSAFVSLGRIPKGVMCFCTFVSLNGILLPAPADMSQEVWYPESVDYSSLSDTLPNVGGVPNRYDIRRNVDMIRTLYPEVKNIAFVSDNTYGGISLQALVRKEWANYPDLGLTLIDSRQGEDESHLEYALLPPHSVALLGTWRVGRDGEYFMQRSLTELVQENPQVPVFSVSGTGIGDVAIGGYVPQYTTNSAAPIVAQIRAYYRSGEFSSLHFHPNPGYYKFDSRKLKEWKIADYNLPRDSVIEDTAAAKLSRYSHYIKQLIIGIALLVILLLVVTWLMLRTRRLKRTLEEREGQLVVAREKAEESDMLKSAFLANMSHEIRTPLNAIVGFSSLMQDEELTQAERTEYSAIVVSNSEMLLMLLNDILDISSLECGKIRFNYASEDIVQICQHVILTTAHTRQEGVEMRFECPVPTFMLSTDAHRLSQILINLLTNAGKFTAEGSITLGVEIDDQAQEVLFSVADTGPGIPLDKQEMVFNRFEKLDGNKKKGTGLGLAICRQIAVIVGGRIWVDPSYTSGARFVFAHPMHLATAGGENSEGGGDLSPQKPANPSV